MENILEELNQTPGILGSLIIGRDGLVIIPMWETEIDTDIVGADSADLYNTAETMVSEKFSLGSLDSITLESEEAKFILKSVDDATFLVVATAPRVNLGLIRIEMKAAAEKLKEVL